ncbi:MAG TPA: SRPBCC domain-containing protein [Bryobacteraceae bacterium]|nr:SRPBCC domain-containing protein [Bryobacteraceae bacterium]
MISIRHDSNRATRRQLLAGAVLACNAWSADQEEISHQAESIRQEKMFRASRKRVYEALLDTKLFDMALREAMKSMSLESKPSQIDRQVGGAFSLFGGHILGRQVELVPNERIVQAWRTADWHPGHYSIARFELMEQGTATKLVFDHTGFPEGQGQHLLEGWNSHYWGPLAKYVG